LRPKVTRRAENLSVAMGDEPKSAATGKPPCLRTPEKLAADVIVAQIGGASGFSVGAPGPD
jgi:hypothetical protein